MKTLIAVIASLMLCPAILAQKPSNSNDQSLWWFGDNSNVDKWQVGDLDMLTIIHQPSPAYITVFGKNGSLLVHCKIDGKSGNASDCQIEKDHTLDEVINTMILLLSK